MVQHRGEKKKKKIVKGNKKHVPAMTFLFMFRLELPLCRLGLVNLCSKKTADHALCPLRFNSTNEIISASLASLPLHNTKMPISLSSRSLTLSLFHSLPHTHMHRGLHRKSTVCCLYRFHTGISTHSIDTHTPTRDGHTHAHKQTERVRERERETPNTKTVLIP